MSHDPPTHKISLGEIGVGHAETCVRLGKNDPDISLLSVPGKVFSRIIVNRIIDNYESILDETRCGYRKQRGTIFTARQIQEKAREQVCNLYVCFFDLKKAYDSVSIQICLMASTHSLWFAFKNGQHYTPSTFQHGSCCLRNLI